MTVAAAGKATARGTAAARGTGAGTRGRGSSTSSPAEPPETTGEGPADRPARPGPAMSGAPPALDHGAGVILGVLLWCWVAMPFIRGTGKGQWSAGDGLTQVRNVLKAKFTNKAPDGSWLP